MKKTIEYVVIEEPCDMGTRVSVSIRDFVRCKDCKHRESYGPYLFCERHGMSVDADYYCADGIREDGDNG